MISFHCPQLLDDVWCVARLGEVVSAARGGHDLSAKLHTSAVNVLFGKPTALQGRWEKVCTHLRPSSKKGSRDGRKRRDRVVV